jgi:DNA repair protein RadC
MNNSTHKGAGHRQRLREKFLQSGLTGFHDYEVIELLLTLATPQKDCKDPAKDALKRFKTFQGVIEASPKELCEVKGIGPKNLLGIKLIQAVARRYLKKRLINKDTLSNTREVLAYLNHTIKNKKQECFMAIFMDAKNNAIATETLFTGTLSGADIYPREVLTAALKHNAAALMFAHNHPSGHSDPSPEDVLITRQLVFACKLIGITVHEHIVIGENEHFSFAENGYIHKMNQDFKEFTKK